MPGAMRSFSRSCLCHLYGPLLASTLKVMLKAALVSHGSVEYEAEAAWKCAPYMADGVRTLGWHAQHQRLERQRLDQTVCHYTVFASELLKSSTLRLCSGPTLGLGLEISMDIECP